MLRSGGFFFNINAVRERYRVPGFGEDKVEDTRGDAMEIDGEEVAKKASTLQKKKKKSGGGLFAKPALETDIDMIDDVEGEIDFDDDAAPLPEPEPEGTLDDLVIIALTSLLETVGEYFEERFINQ